MKSNKLKQNLPLTPRYVMASAARCRHCLSLINQFIHNIQDTERIPWNHWNPLFSCPVAKAFCSKTWWETPVMTENAAGYIYVKCLSLECSRFPKSKRDVVNVYKIDTVFLIYLSWPGMKKIFCLLGLRVQELYHLVSRQLSGDECNLLKFTKDGQGMMRVNI